MIKELLSSLEGLNDREVVIDFVEAISFINMVNNISVSEDAVYIALANYKRNGIVKKLKY